MRKILILLALGLVSASVTACVTDQQAMQTNATPQPAAPQPAPTALQDGLATLYYGATFDHVDDLMDWTEYRDGIPGSPVAGLEHRAGTDDVMTSGASDLVGAKITGYLQLPEAGSYRLQVTANDGVRIFLGDALVHDDPKVGPDRTTESAPFQITTPGWYPLTVWYFEKRGSSTLAVLWQTPQSGGFQSIPAENLKHGG